MTLLRINNLQTSVASEYGLGGYEVERTPYAPDAAERVVEAFRAMSPLVR